MDIDNCLYPVVSIHMKKNLSILILTIISLSCKSQIKADFEFSEKEKDSISNIIDKLYGNWISIDKEILELNETGIYNCNMTFDECLILRDISDDAENKPTDSFKNRICIEEIIPISERPINSPEPNFKHINSLIKKHYLPDSYEVFIIKKNNSFGFLYPADLDNIYFPIKFLNDDSLILMDGREFKKIK